MVVPEHGRIRRADVPAYLQSKFGITIAKATLNKMATVGGGPRMQYDGRRPLYHVDDLDQWASARLSGPVASTSERAAIRAGASA
ncbi:hypothetical protein JQ506_13030 [Shinella sp. PSBB067]|uniref:hypothetical protein n=1 Tax=Shinella sp. PSBB067 TaxID=2715959 RepID=UPI00193C6C10|nr:hypothetical protein [Shinella sp. PSBB067]QRI61832.1 hypothetical protein JQ506_13030 [Shinella sp. PSBB067]